MRPYLRNSSILLLIACYKIASYIFFSREYSAVPYLIDSLGLGKPYFNSGFMVVLITDLFPIFIIQFLEGISIYTHFCIGSVYYFSRQENRKRWYLKEIIKMGLMNTIQLEHVAKTIKQQPVLKDVNISLQSGMIYGFIGKNGSGKTMLFRMIAGLIRPTDGVIYVNSKRLHKDISIVPNLGITLENTGLYPEFTGFQNLKFLAGINKKIGSAEIKEAIKLFGLNPDDKRTIKKYSLGMRQRILLAQAIMERPEYLLLDEPSNGLDEDGMKLVRTFIKNEKARGTMVLLASHNKEDIDQLCDKVYQVRAGNVTGD